MKKFVMFGKMFYSPRGNFLTLPIFIFVFLFTSPVAYAATNWYFPMDRYEERQTVKLYGQLIDDNFYKGKESLFPFNRFYGYHAAVDLEAFTSEKNSMVPIFAASSGTITYIGSLPGYGGLILQKLDNENLPAGRQGATVLYGHVKITDLSVRVGDHIEINDKPIKLTYLGEEFSEETSKERKHLHFGIYKGTELYFRGHEVSIADLDVKWHEPTKFLKERNAKEPVINTSPETLTNKPIEKDIKKVTKNTNLFYDIVEWIKKIFRNE